MQNLSINLFVYSGHSNSTDGVMDRSDYGIHLVQCFKDEKLNTGMINDKIPFYSKNSFCIVPSILDIYNVHIIRPDCELKTKFQYKKISI